MGKKLTIVSARAKLLKDRTDASLCYNVQNLDCSADPTNSIDFIAPGHFNEVTSWTALHYKGSLSLFNSLGMFFLCRSNTHKDSTKCCRRNLSPILSLLAHNRANKAFLLFHWWAHRPRRSVGKLFFNLAIYRSILSCFQRAIFGAAFSGYCPTTA